MNPVGRPIFVWGCQAHPVMGTVPPMMSAERLSSDERTRLREALRVPRGRYKAERAAQLSGVPTRTVYHWAQTGTLVPDYDDSPKSWSYRDLLYLRLTAWLRTKGVPLSVVVEMVQDWRDAFSGDTDPHVTTMSADGVGVAFGDHFDVDILSGQTVFSTMVKTVETFDLLDPLGAANLGRSRLWGPNLVRPSRNTTMSPWVMRGEPCLRGSRLATGPLYALATNRRLDAEDIAHLYPGVEASEVAEAIELEGRLRAAA